MNFTLDKIFHFLFLFTSSILLLIFWALFVVSLEIRFSFCKASTFRIAVVMVILISVILIICKGLICAVRWFTCVLDDFRRCFGCWCSDYVVFSDFVYHFTLQKYPLAHEWHETHPCKCNPVFLLLEIIFLPSCRHLLINYLCVDPEYCCGSLYNVGPDNRYLSPLLNLFIMRGMQIIRFLCELNTEF